MIVSITIDIDWELLRKQKQVLLDAIELADSGDTPKAVEGLNGILFTIDAIQDRAAEQIGEHVVFGEDIDG